MFCGRKKAEGCICSRFLQIFIFHGCFRTFLVEAALIESGIARKSMAGNLQRNSTCWQESMWWAAWVSGDEPHRVSSYFSDADCCKMVEGIVKGQKVIGSMIES